MSVLDDLQGVAIAPLPNCAQVQLTGADALSFLHRLSTQNCQELQPGQSCLNTLLTPKGRLVDALHQVVLSDNSLLLLGGQDQQKRLQQWLENHLFTEDVQVHNVSRQHTLWWVMGKQTSSVLKHLFSKPLPQKPWQCSLHNNHLLIRTFDCVDSYGQSVPSWLLRIPNNESNENDENNALLDTIQSHCPVHVLNPSEMETARIAAAIPRCTNEINDQTNPLQLGLHAAIHMDKGCYVGQEVISRLMTYNKVRSHLVRLLCNKQTHQHLNASQHILLHNQQVGQITSVSPLWLQHAAVALAVVKLPADTTLPTDALVQFSETDRVSVRLHAAT